MIAYNREHADIELSLFNQSIFEASAATGSLTDEVYLTARRNVNKAARGDGIDALLKDYKIDALVTHSGIAASRIDPVHGDVWPRRGGRGMHTDKEIFSFGYAYEQRTQHRVEPKFLKSAEERYEIGSAMKRPEKWLEAYFPL